MTFIQLLEETFTEIEAIHHSSTERLAAGLLNKTLIPRDQVRIEYDRLLKKYTAELDLFLASQDETRKTKQFETIRQSFLNRPSILIPTIAIGFILILAQFTDAISTIKKFFESLLGEA